MPFFQLDTGGGISNGRFLSNILLLVKFILLYCVHLVKNYAAATIGAAQLQGENTIKLGGVTHSGERYFTNVCVVYSSVF